MKGQKEMNEYFQKILDDIKSSTKEIKILPSINSVKKTIAEKYEIIRLEFDLLKQMYEVKE